MRQYVPEPGTSVRLKEMVDYHRAAVACWGWFRVLSTDLDRWTATLEHTDFSGGKGTGITITVPLDRIQVPIGWAPRYTIYCSPSEVEKVLGWFTRGICVRHSRDLSYAGRVTFQPLDNCEPVYWWDFAGEPTDRVKASECSKAFRIVMVEEQNDPEEIVSIPRLANGKRGRVKVRQAIADLRRGSWKVGYRRAYNMYYAVRETVVRDWEQEQGGNNA